MKKNLLKLSGFFGLVSLLAGIPLTAADLNSDFSLQGTILLLLVSLLILSYLVFLAGFIYLGNLTKNTLMIISSYCLILIGSLNYAMLYLSQTYANWTVIYEQAIVIIVFGISFGLAGVFHGFSLLKLKEQLGNIASRTGWVEMIFGFSLLTLVLSPIAILLIIPLYILEIMLLLKANKVRI